MSNPLDAWMGGFGDTVGHAVVNALMPILEPKLDSLFTSITNQVKADVTQLLQVAHTDLGKALGDMGDALKADL
jgi:hypothetical protein